MLLALRRGGRARGARRRRVRGGRGARAWLDVARRLGHRRAGREARARAARAGPPRSLSFWKNPSAAAAQGGAAAGPARADEPTDRVTLRRNVSDVQERRRAQLLESSRGRHSGIPPTGSAPKTDLCRARHSTHRAGVEPARVGRSLEPDTRALPPPWFGFAPTGLEVLEIGCGKGALLSRMRLAGHTASGIDPDADAIACCSKTYPGIDAGRHRLRRRPALCRSELRHGAELRRLRAHSGQRQALARSATRAQDRRPILAPDAEQVDQHSVRAAARAQKVR